MALLAFSGLGLAAVATKPVPKKTVAPARKAAPVARKAAAPVAARGKAPVKTAVRGKSAPTSRTTRSARSAPPRPRYQSVPSQARYQEIQQSLASRGYFSGEPDGTWGPNSVEALKRFQQEQNLAPSGRVDSLTLIALGLGPKRNLAAGTSPDLNTLPRPQDDNRRPQGSERP